MTLAPRACAVLMIAAPEPGSRSTSRMTLAPLVSAWSAWLRWVLGSPCALTIVCLMPAALNAWSRYLRSCVSQRTDDCVSGSSTAMPPLTFPTLPLDLLFEEPQPTAMAAAAITRAASAHRCPMGYLRGASRPAPDVPLGVTPRLTTFVLLLLLDFIAPPRPASGRRRRGRTARRRARAPRAVRRDRPALLPPRARRPPRRGWRSGARRRASARAGR